MDADCAFLRARCEDHLWLNYQPDLAPRRHPAGASLRRRCLDARTFPEVSSAADAAAVKLRRTGFNVQEVVGDDSVVLHLQGELDMATAAHLRHALDHALTGDATGLVLDLTDLTFVDSTGINLFLSASRQAEDRDDLLRAAPVSQRVPGAPSRRSAPGE